MTTYGYFLSCEEFPPADLLEQARMAEQAGFTALAISDHYHPWNNEQGNSPFVWSVIGALSQVTSLPMTTVVSCPTVRLHPAVTAQAAATSGVITDGRFRLGVGTGEALNEHILGDAWPEAQVRTAMLEEAIAVMRRLFTGEQVSHHGTYYTVQNAKLYTLPEEQLPILISGLGPQSAALAGRIGDGFVTLAPDIELVEQFRKSGGAGKPVIGSTKVCWSADRDEARRTVHRLWPHERLPGELALVLPTTAHVEQASQLVTEEAVGEAVVCGDDAAEHTAALLAYADSGFDEVYVGQIGTEQQGFFDFYRSQVLPRLAE